MKSLKYAVVVVAALGLAACRQANGPMPPINATIQEELVDVGHDLQNISRKDPQGPQDLAHDLRKYAERTVTHPSVDELSKRTATVLVGKKVDEQTGNRLAHTLWTAVAGRELSDRQIETVQNDLQAILVSVGVEDAAAQQVAGQVAAVQKQVTTREKRWYEWF